jgi:hypothetical protein
LADVDLRQLAKKVRAAGRGRDTVLAHITPAEAKLLKARGGRGSVNPKTGLPEFQDDDFGGFDFGGDGNQQIYDAGGGYDGSGDGGPDQTFAGTPEQQTRADEAVAAIRSPDFFAGTPDLTSDQAQTLNTAVNSINRPDFLSGTPDLNRDQAQTLNTALTAINQPNFLGDTSPGLLQRLTSGLGLGNIGGADLARLGLAGAGVGMGVQARNAALQQARSSQGQIQNIANQAQQRAATTQQAMTGTAEDVAGRAAPAQAAIQALAAPYQQMGSQQVQQALSGTLTPMSAQSLQAAQARQAQAQARSGGVGAAQGINQLEGLRQALLSSQYQQGLGTQQIGDRYAQSGITTGLAQGNLGSQYSNLATTTGLNASGIADQYTLRAIQAGLAGNQEAQRLAQAYFQSLGSILGGTPALRAQQPATTAVG